MSSALAKLHAAHRAIGAVPSGLRELAHALLALEQTWLEGAPRKGA